MASIPFVKRLVPGKWMRTVQERRVALTVSHLFGPKHVRINSDQAVVTCVVRNGAFYVEQFVQHYFRLGVQHIVFLDNGSTDQTIAIAKTFPNVSMFRSSLPIGGYQPLLKRYLAHTFSKGGWCLDADIDEFFDYPYSDVVPLPALLGYLNDHSYTAVVTQLLDLFSDQPLSHLPEDTARHLRVTYRYYDISSVTATEYRRSPLVMECGFGNEVPNREAALLWGGIRETLYGNHCLLTKHSLFRNNAGLDLFPHVHFVNHAKLADISGVMLHYKLTKDILNTAIQNRAGFTVLSKSYTDCIDCLVANPDLRIKRDSASLYQGAEDLVSRGFLFSSADYRHYVNSLGRGAASRQCTSQAEDIAGVSTQSA